MIRNLGLQNIALQTKVRVSLCFLCLLDSVASGAATKNRTRDLLITNQLLYLLSYSGIGFLSPNQTGCGYYAKTTLCSNI